MDVVCPISYEKTDDDRENALRGALIMSDLTNNKQEVNRYECASDSASSAGIYEIDCLALLTRGDGSWDQIFLPFGNRGPSLLEFLGSP